MYGCARACRCPQRPGKGVGSPELPDWCRDLEEPQVLLTVTLLSSPALMFVKRNFLNATNAFLPTWLPFLSFFAIFFYCCCYFSGILMSSPSVFIWSLYIHTTKISLDCLESQQPGLLILNSKQSSCLSLWSAEGLQAYTSTPTLCRVGLEPRASRKLGSGLPPQLSAAQEGGVVKQEETGKGCLWTFIVLLDGRHQKPCSEENTKDMLGKTSDKEIRACLRSYQSLQQKPKVEWAGYQWRCWSRGLLDFLLLWAGP